MILNMGIFFSIRNQEIVGGLSSFPAAAMQL